MTDKLVEYMVELNTNPEALAKHNASPEGAAKAFGLDNDDIQLIKDNKVDEIKKRCDASSINTKGLIVFPFKS